MATIVSVDATVRNDARRFSDGLGALLRLVQFRDRDRACCYDVSVTQCYALTGVVRAGELTVNELAAHLYLDKSTASRVANSLVEKGYLQRVRDQRDARVVRLAATPAGGALHKRIEDDLTQEYTDLLSDFEPEVRGAMNRLMERLAASFAARVEVSGGSCCVVK